MAGCRSCETNVVVFSFVMVPCTVWWFFSSLNTRAIGVWSECHRIVIGLSFDICRFCKSRCHSVLSIFVSSIPMILNIQRIWVILGVPRTTETCANTLACFASIYLIFLIPTSHLPSSSLFDTRSRLSLIRQPWSLWRRCHYYWQYNHTGWLEPPFVAEA